MGPRHRRPGLAALALLSVMLALPACGSLGTGRVYRASVAEDCRYYDDAHLAWNAVAMAGSAMGVVGAGSGLLVDGISDAESKDDWTTGLVITGAVGSVLAVIGNWLGQEYAVRHSERCSEQVRQRVEPGGVPSGVPVEYVYGEGDDLDDSTLLDIVAVPPASEMEVLDETVELPVLPEPVVEPGPGETGTGSDGLADDATLEGDAP